MPALSELYRKYRSKVNFVFVYILEAHAQDEWPIRSSRDTPKNAPVLFNQTKCVEDRCFVATEFKKDFCVEYPIVFDDPQSNSFEKLYAPWPVRLYLVDNNKKLLYKAQPGEDMLELKPLKSLLATLAEKTK